MYCIVHTLPLMITLLVVEIHLVQVKESASCSFPQKLHFFAARLSSTSLLIGVVFKKKPTIFALLMLCANAKKISLSAPLLSPPQEGEGTFSPHLLLSEVERRKKKTNSFGMRTAFAFVGVKCESCGLKQADISPPKDCFFHGCLH